jgi:hypothetical protein
MLLTILVIAAAGTLIPAVLLWIADHNRRGAN